MSIEQVITALFFWGLDRMGDRHSYRIPCYEKEAANAKA